MESKGMVREWGWWLFLLLALLLAACGRDVAKQDLRELRVGIEDQPKTLDPRYATDAYGMRISHQLLFSTLVDEDYDLRIVPALAQKWETPDDTTYIFTLRRDVLFQDGQPLTAADVQFTFHHLMDPKTASPFGGVLRSTIDSIEVLDPYTVRFKLKHPSASFLSTVILPILPAHLIEQNPKEFADHLVGSGPFKLASQSPGEIVLVPNELFYGGRPRYDRLVLKVVTDDSTRFLKMKKGELDLLINAIPLDKVDEVKKPPLDKTYTVIEEPGLSYNYIAFNLQDPVLRDLRVRQAIAYAINVDEIIAYKLGGHAVRATGLLAPLNPFYEPDVTTYPYDPAKARALLASAGLPGAGENSRPPALHLELKTSNNAQAVGIARIIQAQLAAMGIQLDTRSYEWATFYGDVRSGNFQMTTMRWVGITDPDFYYDIFHSSQVPPGGSNRGRYANPEIDRLLETGRITLNFDSRKAIYSELQKRLAVELPYVGLWHSNNISIVNKRVTGYRQHPTGNFASFKDITLSGGDATPPYHSD